MTARAASRRPRGGSGTDPGARARLLAAAARLFAAKGYAGTPVGEIVAAAGVTRPVLYYWFESKEGIYQALLREAFATFETLVDEAVRGPGDATARLRRLCARALDLMQERLDIVRIMYAVYYGPPQGAPRFDFDFYHTRFREAVRGLVEEGARRGALRRRDAEGQAWAVIGALNMCVEIQLCHPELASSPRALFGRIFDTVLTGLVAPQPRESKR